MSEIVNELNYWKEQLQLMINNNDQSGIAFCEKEIKRLEKLL